MQMETRNLGVTTSHTLEQEAEHALGAALDRFETRVQRVRVRLLAEGPRDASCRVRVWCENGPTVVVQERGASVGEAMHAVADTLNRALRKRWSERRTRRRRGASRRIGVHVRARRRS